MFIKLGEPIEISKIENAESCVPQVNAEILEHFQKFARDLKKIAPKAEDFLYFSAVMMHAAEASALNDDGTIKLNARGEPVKVGWNKSGGTWRWETNDPSIKPYRNANLDIFPEEELVKAHKKWQHKPLCIDHKSSSIDHVRGFIVDTYYDRALKRVIALCALDKAGWPQLARQVSTGISNCVSMGTAVGRAICSDCATVARVESDFCRCMKNKSCYGEINVDLNPIELSIVVNGADPKATIKHIIAAANTLNTYVENKSKEFTKLANSYKASINFVGGDDNSSNINISSDSIDQFKQDLDDAFEKLKNISQNIQNSEKDSNDLALNQSSSHISMDDGEPSEYRLAPPSERFASISEIKNFTESIEAKLNQMKQSLDKLANSNTHEENMSGSNNMNKKGYYQGTEEPKPGQAQYAKDPLNEKLRTDEDRQMVGQSPFPSVGPVDGMHPSPDSADPSNELERKKMLARAEAEDRALRRQAIVQVAKQALENKMAYIQNGLPPNNPNSPAPGKVKYPIDKLNEQLRDYEDKQMVGQKPFPGVGPVDGMHPSPSSADVADEKKRKEMIQRASLRAKFIKAANGDGTQNFGNSGWEVFLGDKLLLTASVNDLSGGRSEVMYDSIATREFGTKLIEKVKVFGADKINALVKSGQVVDPAAMGAPAPTPGPDSMGGAAPVNGAPPVDTGKDGDKKDSAIELAERARDINSDLVEAVRALTGEQAEMGDDVGAPPMASAASDNFSTAHMNSFRRELNGELIVAMKEVIAELNDHKEELDTMVDMYNKGTVNPSNSEFVGTIVDAALADTKTAIANGFNLMTAFVKYARGTSAIVKRAEIEAELEALAEGETMSESEEDSNSSEDLLNLINSTDSDLSDAESLLNDDPSDEAGEDFEGENLDGLGDLTDIIDDESGYDSGDAQTVEVKPGQAVPAGLKDDATIKVTNASYGSRENRAALRAKLAADALGKYDDGQIQDMSKQKFSDMLDQADHLADGQTELDVKPSDNLGLVETLPEINKAMLELAKAPPKVRKEAELIHKLVSRGELDPSDFDALIAEGLDKDAVAYYKKFYGQVDGGNEFASELVKEHVKAGFEEEINVYKVKLGRAYELTHDMVDRGLCHSDRIAITAQIDEIMKFNDESFSSLKRVVAKHDPLLRKEASGRLPQVGMIGSGDISGSTPVTGDNLYSELSAAFSKTTKKMF